MADIASLGLAIDSSQVKAATGSLDKFATSANTASQAAAKTEAQNRATEAAAKRLGISYAEMEARMKATSNSFTEQGTRARFTEQVNIAAARAMGTLSGAAGSLGDGLSRLHPVFGSLGGGALTLTAVLAGLAIGYKQLQDAAMALADRAGKLEDFAETTGFTTIQLQALEKAGAAVGVTADSVNRGLERFSVAMDDVKKGSGSAYEAILEINPGLAQQFTKVKDLSAAWDLFAKAIKGADLEQANKLARGMFGRSGVEITRLARANADAGGIDGVVAQLKEVDRLTKEQTKRWDDLGDTINENMKIAKQNIAAIFTDAVLSGMERFSRGFLEVSETFRNFTMGDDFKKFMAWTSSPAGMAVLGGLGGAALGGMTGGIPGAIIGGLGMGGLGLAKGLSNQNEQPSARVTINGGTIDADAAKLEERKRILEISIKDQERLNAAIGAAATPLQQHTLATDKLTLAFLQNKLEMQGTADSTKRASDATKAYEAAQGRLNAAFSEQKFAAYAGAMSASLTIEEQVRVKRDQLNAANRAGAGITKEQIAVQEQLVRENALGITQIQAQISGMEAQANTWGKSAGQAQAYLLVQQKITEAKLRGAALNDNQIRQLEDEAAEMGKLIDKQQEFSKLRDLAQGFTGDLVQGLMDGKSGMDALRSAAKSLASTLAQDALRSLFKLDFVTASVGGVGTINLAKLTAPVKQPEKEIDNVSDQHRKAA